MEKEKIMKLKVDIMVFCKHNFVENWLRKYTESIYKSL